MQFDAVIVFLARLKKWAQCCIGLIVLILAASLGFGEDESWVMAKWVADGDTIVLHDGRHVRYIGIDSPEIDHKNHQSEPMGDEALAMNRRLVEGRQLRLVFDQEKKDRYGRYLAYVYRRDGVFVNAELLKAGYAHVLSRFPNNSKEQDLLVVQRAAMEQGRGIWRWVKKDATPVHAYWGSLGSKRFHAHDCPMAKKMADKNRVGLKNQWTAFWDGYSPAKACIHFPMAEK